MKIKNNLLIQLDEVGKREYVRVTLTSENCREILEYIITEREKNEELKRINEQHQSLNGELREEIKKKDNRIHAVEKYNERLQLEAQKYFDLLMECEYGKNRRKK